MQELANASPLLTIDKNLYRALEKNIGHPALSGDIARAEKKVVLNFLYIRGKEEP
jgi:hypothetical protein